MGHVDGEPTQKIAKMLLEHKDHRFRLSYILGSMRLLSPVSNEDELSDEDEDEETQEELGEILLTDEEWERLPYFPPGCRPDCHVE